MEGGEAAHPIFARTSSAPTTYMPYFDFEYTFPDFLEALVRIAWRNLGAVLHFSY
jgi:hypothetical protein